MQQQSSNDQEIIEEVPHGQQPMVSSSNECEIEEVIEPSTTNSCARVAVDAANPAGESSVQAMEDETCRNYVYVAVGKGSTSMGALDWTLKNITQPGNTVIYLVHVFPEVHHVPTPLGMIPRDQLRPFQVEAYLNQERTKRREMLQKPLNMCHSSEVEVDTVLIESSQVAKAIIELIPVLNIRTLVVGARRSQMRRFMKGNSIAEQVYKSSPEYCEVKIICDNREITTTDGTPSPLVDSANTNATNDGNESRSKNSLSCSCFFKN